MLYIGDAPVKLNLDGVLYRLNLADKPAIHNIVHILEQDVVAYLENKTILEVER
jgi:hypothetical protein